MLTARLLVLALAWVLTPGLTETAENLWHLASAGHAAHDVAAGDDHTPADDEHGCSGTFHLCTCHPSLNATLAAATAPLGFARAGGRPARFRAEVAPDPWRAAPFHPPRV